MVNLAVLWIARKIVYPRTKEGFLLFFLFFFSLLFYLIPPFNSFPFPFPLPPQLNIRKEKRMALWSFPMMLLMFSNGYTWYLSLAHTPVSVNTVIYNSASVSILYNNYTINQKHSKNMGF